MVLEAGTHLGDYEVLSSLGAGGMGEVYRALDTKLGREVAVKVLLDEVSADPERLARFEREARVLASLNHPNVATLYGFFTATPVPPDGRGRSLEIPQADSPESEKEGDTSYLVMELVEGETLADRIARGPIPIDEAIGLFVQIAEGLEAAHSKGVVHRDLKPANIKISDQGAIGAGQPYSGRVKILDFGLAKAMAPEASPESNPSESPTITSAGYSQTRHGEILGTAAYMSPEQATGRAVDRSADIWAFGSAFSSRRSAESERFEPTTRPTPWPRSSGARSTGRTYPNRRPGSSIGYCTAVSRGIYAIVSTTSVTCDSSSRRYCRRSPEAGRQKARGKSSEGSRPGSSGAQSLYLW